MGFSLSKLIWASSWIELGLVAQTCKTVNRTILNRKKPSTGQAFNTNLTMTNQSTSSVHEIVLHSNLENKKARTNGDE
jgi:hypothetical protein